MNGGASWAAVHGVAKTQTWLSDFTFTFHFHALEKEMATHSSVLAWRIPGMGEPGGLPSMGSHRVRHYWSDLAAAAALIFTLLQFSFWKLWKPLPPHLLHRIYSSLIILRSLRALHEKRSLCTHLCVWFWLVPGQNKCLLVPWSIDII